MPRSTISTLARWALAACLAWQALDALSIMDELR
jgi:hypothetical protein